MKQLYLSTGNFLRDEEGVTIIEYGLIAALIGIGVVATVLLVQDEINNLFTKIATCLSGGTCT